MLVAKINCESLENCQEELFLVKLPTYNVETTTLLLGDFSKDSLQNMFRKVHCLAIFSCAHCLHYRTCNFTKRGAHFLPF